MSNVLKWLVEKVLRPRWIVNSEGDLGLRVGGINFWYYKWPDPIIGCYKVWRVMGKREFGESIQSTYDVQYWPKSSGERVE